MQTACGVIRDRALLACPTKACSSSPPRVLRENIFVLRYLDRGHCYISNSLSLGRRPLRTYRTPSKMFDPNFACVVCAHLGCSGCHNALSHSLDNHPPPPRKLNCARGVRSLALQVYPTADSGDRKALHHHQGSAFCKPINSTNERYRTAVRGHMMRGSANQGRHYTSKRGRAGSALPNAARRCHAS